MERQKIILNIFISIFWYTLKLSTEFVEVLVGYYD